MQPPKSRKKIGLTRREMEWAVEGMLRNVPADPRALARQLAGLMMALLEQNNAALAAALPGPREPEESESR